jgi:hypothetical protein
MVAEMGRPLVHAAAWILATSAAVTLSWFGVHTVLTGTEYDPPRTLPLSGDVSPADPDASAAPADPAPSDSRSSRPTNSPTDGGGSGESPPRSPDRTSPAYGGSVRGTTVTGGRAVFNMQDDYATLVSATPTGGWDTQVYKERTWIRVVFSKQGAPSSSVFCRWDDGPPRIETSSP